MMCNAFDVQQTKANKWKDENLCIYIYIYYDHRRHWKYKPSAIKHMSPQLRLICAQGRDYIYVYIYIYNAGTGSCVHEPIHHIFRSFAGQHRKMGCCPPANGRGFTSIQMVHTHLIRTGSSERSDGNWIPKPTNWSRGRIVQPQYVHEVDQVKKTCEGSKT